MQTLITCHRCRARVELTTDGRGRLIERRTECTCPPMTEAERADLRRCWRCGGPGARDDRGGVCEPCDPQFTDGPVVEIAGRTCEECQEPMPEAAHPTRRFCAPCGHKRKRRSDRKSRTRNRGAK